MPLKAGKKNIKSNIKELVNKYESTGKIGTSKPKSKKKAIKQAVAISYDVARKR
jgi:hypothetical protein